MAKKQPIKPRRPAKAKKKAPTTKQKAESIGSQIAKIGAQVETLVKRRTVRLRLADAQGKVLEKLPQMIEGLSGQIEQIGKEAAENKALVRRYYDEIRNQKDLGVLDEIIADSFVGHESATPGEVLGLEGFKQVVMKYETAFPDVHFQVEDMVVEGDKVVVRWSASGTHKGELPGIAPTGKGATGTGIDIWQIASGKIARAWTEWDALGVLRQLGVIPEPVQS